MVFPKIRELFSLKSLIFVGEIWSKCPPDLYLIEQECQGEESHQSLDWLEGPEDFQQMILLYKDYVKGLQKIEKITVAFCKCRFRPYEFYS